MHWLELQRSSCELPPLSPAVRTTLIVVKTSFGVCFTQSGNSVALVIKWHSLFILLGWKIIHNNNFEDQIRLCSYSYCAQSPGKVSSSYGSRAPHPVFKVCEYMVRSHASLVVSCQVVVFFWVGEMFLFITGIPDNMLEISYVWTCDTCEWINFFCTFSYWVGRIVSSIPFTSQLNISTNPTYPLIFMRRRMRGFVCSDSRRNGHTHT